MTETTERDWAAIQERLRQFGEWVGRKAPTPVLDDYGAFTTEFLRYAQEEELCLDWAVAGDVRLLAIAYRKRHQTFAWHSVKERMQMLAGEAGIEPVTLEFDGGAVLLTDELMDFCDRANGSLDWLVSGDPVAMVREYSRRKAQSKQSATNVGHLSDAERSALIFTLKLILTGKDFGDAMQTYTRCLEEQRAA